MNQIATFRRRLAGAPVLMSSRLLTLGIAGAFYLLLAAAFIHLVIAEIAAGSFYGLGDYATMWKAGLLIRGHDILTLYDRHRLDLWMQHRFGGPLPDESWLYTPPMGLLAVIVSFAPLRAGFWLWRGATLAAAAWALRRAGLRWWVVLAGLLGPAEFYDLLLGQNGALTGGLLAGALLTLRGRPRFAGALAACLCIKPQLAVLLPVILARRRYHRALAACVVTGAGLAILATLAEGWRAWLFFLTLAQPNAGRILRIPFGQPFQMAGFTVFLMARSLGLGLAAAWAAQGAAALAAGIATWRLWGQPDAEPTARMAMTVCLSMLAMPYGFSYDLVAFSVAVAALAPRAPAAALPGLVLLWFWPWLTNALTLATGVELMPVAALIGLWLASLQLRPAGFDHAGPIH